MIKFFTTLLFCCTFSTLAQAVTVDHNFDVRLGIFDASKTTFSYALTPQSYAVRSLVETNGMFDALYPFKAQYSTSGKISKGKFITESYNYQSKSRFNTRTKKLIYHQGIPVFRLSSKNDETKKVKIATQAKNKDTTDLQTVFAELAYQYRNSKSCDSRMEVFDGKRRFSIIFKDEGREPLKLDGKLKLNDTADKCSMYIDKLSSQDDDLLWELTAQHPVYFWIMQHPQGNIPFIAKIEVEDTPLGKLEVTADNIKIKE